MQIDFRKILIITLSLLWLWLTFTILYGCSANYHFGKFLKKGGKIENKTEYIETTDTIRINGKDSIIVLKLPISCPEVELPATRYQTRLEYRLKRDSIETIRYVTKWKTKEVIKLAKTQNKKPFNWFWIGLGIGLLIPILIKFVIKKI